MVAYWSVYGDFSATLYNADVYVINIYWHTIAC
jgi:hypothetical protein